MFFKREISSKFESKGLYAPLEELVEQKKYLPYIKQRHNNITSDQTGDIRSAFKGRGMEFEEVRLYGFGDDVRDIDWRVTARHGNTYTKVFSEEKDREVYVVLDLSPYMVFGTKKELKSVAASKLAAMLGWQSVINKDRFGLLLYDGVVTRLFKAQNNQKSLMSILKNISQTSKNILYKYATEYDEANILDPLKYLQYSIKSRAVVFVISDFKNTTDDAYKALVTLSKKCKVYCINVYDYIEEVPPESGEYSAQYGRDELKFDTSPLEFKEVYFQYFAKKRKVIECFCKKFGCQYVGIRTDKPLYKQLKIFG